LTIAASAACASKPRAPRAWIAAIIASAGSPVMTSVCVLATDHFGSQPLSRWSAISDLAMSPATRGAISASSGIWLR
jgi:hypothetical protein